MQTDAGDIRPVLLVGGLSSRMGTTTELLILLGCRRDIEYAIETLESVITLGSN